MTRAALRREAPRQPGSPPPGSDRFPLFVFLSALSYGLGIELLSYNFLDSFAHAQFTVMFYGARLPLYVVALKPAAVIILAGTNDIARNTGPQTIEMIEQNFMAMTDLAQKNGIKVISMGLLNPGDKPLVWRGPMLHSVLQQFLRGTDWGTLDHLIIDLPPGTGDVALSVMQTTALAGAVIVTTPSSVSLEDARKAVNMFRKMRVEILGLVENMGYLIAPQS